MFSNFIKKSEELHKGKVPFAVAMVVNRVVPSSGKPGDKAIILADGTVIGWIGGGCTRGIVIKEATSAIREGTSRLVSIRPEGEGKNEPGRTYYNMTCQSGGMVEIYIEPVLPKPHLIIMGKSHVAMALNRIAKAMDYSVSVVFKGAESLTFPGADQVVDGALTSEMILPDTCIVVCTQGDNDEQALMQAVRSNSSYVAFVASRKKGQAVFNQLRSGGISFDELKAIKTPAGLDIKAKLPDEVAISILAQIIEHVRGKNVTSDDVGQSGADTVTTIENSGIYVNPVCGIPVEKATAKHVLEYKNESVYFCCDGCKVQFEATPEKFMESTP